MKWIYELGVDELLPACAINEYTCVVKFLSESRPDSLKSLWLVTGASRAFFQFVCLMKHWRHWHDRRICSVVFIKLGIAEKAGARVFRWRISWAWCDKDAGSENVAAEFSREECEMPGCSRNIQDGENITTTPIPPWTSSATSAAAQGRRGDLFFSFFAPARSLCAYTHSRAP